MLPLVIEPEGLLAVLQSDDTPLIIDLCRLDNYAAGHIPGAIHVAPAEIVSGQPPAAGKLPSIERLEAVLSRIGYSPDRQIVVYDDEGGGWAGRFIWTLDVVGHQKSSYLNGGLIAWVNEQMPLTTEVPKVTPAEVSVDRDLNLNLSVIAEMSDVLESLGDANTKVWDARSPEEHAGIKVAAQRGGHIPGAINLDWLELMDPQNNLKLRQDLNSLLESRGFEADDAIITHCQSHHRSGLSYLVGKHLGRNIRAYHGSWSEWGNDPSTPIEDPSRPPRN